MSKPISISEFRAMSKIDKRNPFYKYLTAEDREHVEFIEYCRNTYPGLIIVHTPSEGKRTPFERYKAALMGLTIGIPDFLIICAQQPFSGLAIELKATGKKIYLKDGKTLIADETIRKQNEMLKRLRDQDWFAAFAIGIDEAKYIFNNYMQLKTT